jgi:glyoxylase-like metal-dependent hydrolase (beta-lactamase superfamily II)
MNEPLEYPWPEIGRGERLDLGEGVRWIRLPLPFSPAHVNVYRLGNWDDSVLVDSGFSDPTTTAIWKRLESDSPVARVLVTHFHPDHIGQAARFEAAGATIHVPAAELEAARALHAFSGERMRESFAAFFEANGLVASSGGLGGGNRYRGAVPRLPQRAESLAAGALKFAPDWEVGFASGHSPAHALLYRSEPATLVAGDILLPNITPNISVWPNAPEADPLGDYLAALERLRTLPETTLVLPAHGLPYRGLHQRIEALFSHHADRLERLRAAAKAGTALSGAGAIRLLFRPDLEASSLLFALGEALAHLNHLWHHGEFERTRDEAGVYRYYGNACAHDSRYE